DPPRLSNALSIAATLGAGLFDAFKAPEPFVEIQIARACEAGIFAAAMAGEGVPGNDEILEKAFIPAHSDEYRLELLSENLSKSYRISQTYIKIHGGCRHIHAPIDATLAIVNEHKIRWNEIERIKVKTYSIARTLEIEHPETGDDAKFNMAFGIAVALIRGNALSNQFTTENLKNAQIQELMKKVIVETSLDLDKDYPAKRGTMVEVTTQKGKAFSQALDLARGEPEFPMTREEIDGKFKQLTAGLIPEAQTAKIIEFIDTIEDRKELRDLFAYLTDFQFSPDEEKFQEEVQKFFLAEEKVVTAAREEWDAGQGFGPNCWEIMRKIGAKGWLCPMWPKEYGGLGLPYMYRYIIMEQMQYFLNMWSTVGAGMAGPIILKH
ncbi:MAG: acyl-CoA dehydrogenase family protein, partial [Deltaproteobacteria bacterium]|nr:acyl-CoA dehydrogenase family protein [Deltaproteobacteria bacterium]